MTFGFLKIRFFYVNGTCHFNLPLVHIYLVVLVNHSLYQNLTSFLVYLTSYFIGRRDGKTCCSYKKLEECKQKIFVASACKSIWFVHFFCMFVIVISHMVFGLRLLLLYLYILKPQIMMSSVGAVKDLDKLQNVLSMYEEEHLKPDEQTLIYISKVLSENGREVPFNITNTKVRCVSDFCLQLLIYFYVFHHGILYVH